MDQLSFKTKFANNTLEKEWFVLDAEGQTVGRLATKVASVLKGKHKPTYTPNVDAGDYVIIVNSDKIRFTGNKWNDKVYVRHTGYPGGQRHITAKDVNKKHPIFVVETAIRGMLPKNSLGRAMFRKMFVYASSTHPHTAQSPKTLTVN